MNQLLPIIRRVRRPLIAPETKPVKADEPASQTTPPTEEAVPIEPPRPEAPNEAETDY